MDEYRLVGSGTTPNSTQKCVEETEDWVVYRVFQKRRKPKKHGVRSQPSSNNNKAQSIIDLVVEDSSDPGPPQPYSPSSSSDIS
ncbi:hypothetical protein, partial [Enterococcus faecium]